MYADRPKSTLVFTQDGVCQSSCNDGFVADSARVCHSCGDLFYDRKNRKCVYQCAAINVSKNDQGQWTKYCEVRGTDECPYTASSICVRTCQHFAFGLECVEICPSAYSVDASSGVKTCDNAGENVLKVQDPLCQNMLKEYVYEPYAFCAVGDGFKEADANITNVAGFSGLRYVDIDKPGTVKCKFNVLSNVEDSLSGKIFVFNATVNASGCSQLEVAPIDSIGTFEGRFYGTVNVINAPQVVNLYKVAKTAENSCSSCQEYLNYTVSVTNTVNLSTTQLETKQIGSGPITGCKTYTPEANTTFSFNISGRNYKVATLTSLSATENTEYYMATHRIYLENARHYLNGKQVEYFTTKDDVRFEVAITQTQNNAVMTYSDPEQLVSGEVRCLNKLDPQNQTCEVTCSNVSLLSTCFNRCPRNFFLLEAECWQKCPLGTTANYETMTCERNEREKCDGGKALLGGSCVSSCYPGMGVENGACTPAAECPRYRVVGNLVYCANECPAGTYVSAEGSECVQECPEAHNATHCIAGCGEGFVSEDGYCGAACRPQFVEGNGICTGTAPFCADNQSASISYRICVSCSEPDKYFDRAEGACKKKCTFYNETDGVNICEAPNTTYCPLVNGYKQDRKVCTTECGEQTPYKY